MYVENTKVFEHNSLSINRTLKNIHTLNIFYIVITDRIVHQIVTKYTLNHYSVNEISECFT